MESSNTETQELSQTGLSLSRAEFRAECEDILIRTAGILHFLDCGYACMHALENLYREIHALRVTAEELSYPSLGAVALAMESSLEGVHMGTHRPSLPLVEALLEGLGVIATELQSLQDESLRKSGALTLPQLKELLAKSSLGIPSYVERTRPKRL